MTIGFHLFHLLALPLSALVVTVTSCSGLRNQLRRTHRLAYPITVIPGTTLHELAHALTALAFGMEVTKITFWTGQFEGRQGYVNFRYRPSVWSAIGLFFVGLAPLLLLLAGGYAVLLLCLPELNPVPVSLWHLAPWVRVTWLSVADFQWSWGLLPGVLAAVVILPHVVPSLADLKIAAKGGLAVVIIGVLLFFLAGYLDKTDMLLNTAYTAQAIIMAASLWLLIICLAARLLLWFGTRLVRLLIAYH